MNLFSGSRGEEVKKLQKRLTEWGFPLVADGIFGPKTEEAVEEFQKALGLRADGIVGKNTKTALDKQVIKVTHFKKEEFKCACKKYCEGYIDEKDEFGGIRYALLILLERIRAEVKKRYGRTIPCKISTSGGYRCPRYNALVGGATKSYHITGKAADIYFEGVPVSVVNDIGKKVNPFGGLGLKGSRITHVDVRGYRSRWYYN